MPRPWLKRLTRVGVVAGVLTVCPLLVAETAHAAETGAMFAPAPAVPIAGSVLGGTVTGTAATGGAVGTVAAGMFATSATVVGGLALYAGVTYGTYQVLRYSFSCQPGGADYPCEATGAQPPPSNFPGLSLPNVKFFFGPNGSYVGAHSADLPTGFTLVSLPATLLPASTSTSYAVSIGMPAWRCRNGVSSCSTPKVSLYATDDTLVTGGNLLSGFSGASGAAATHTFSGTVNPGATAKTMGAAMVFYEPDKLEWLPAPLHRWRTITTCKNKVTQVSTTITNISAQWSEDTPAADLPDAQVPQCSAGYVGTKLEIWEGDPTGAGGILRYGWTATNTDVSAATQTGVYKSCYPGGADYPCVLQIWKVMPDGSLSNCNQSTMNCTDFNSTTSTTSTYRCMWGTFSMPISDCQPLEHWAQTQTVPTTAPTTSTGPTTTTTVVPIPSTGVNIDPKTGQPKTGTTGVDPDPTDETTGQCMGDTWSWNPVNWVVIPIKCALKWAFVPKTSTMQALSAQVKTAVDTSAPGKWVTAIDDVKAGLPSGGESGCMGPRLAWDKLPGGEMYPFKACDGIMATAAAVTKILATIAVTFFGGLACLRALGSGLGWNPGVGGKST